MKKNLFICPGWCSLNFLLSVSLFLSLILGSSIYSHYFTKYFFFLISLFSVWYFSYASVTGFGTVPYSWILCSVNFFSLFSLHFGLVIFHWAIFRNHWFFSLLCAYQRHSSFQLHCFWFLAFPLILIVFISSLDFVIFLCMISTLSFRTLIILIIVFNSLLDIFNICGISTLILLLALSLQMIRCFCLFCFYFFPFAMYCNFFCHWNLNWCN